MMAKAEFAARSTEPTHSVNYLWLCARGPAKTFPHHATRLPLHNFERMYVNAERYPSAQFNLWVDNRQLTTLDRFFLDSHRYAFKAENVQVHDLCTIPKYKQMPGFEPDSNIALYARADCARVLVLDHLIKRKPNQATIYSDLDCEDVALGDKPVAQALDNYGLAYGRSGGHMICNGYIALKGTKGRDFMSEFLLPRTVNAFQKNLVNHFGAFSDAIRDYRKKVGEKVRLGLVDLPLMRSEMPYDESVYRKVSPKSPTRVPGSRDLV